MTLALSNVPESGTRTPPASVSPRKQFIDAEIPKLWEMFTKIRGAVSCKLVEAIVLSASQSNNAQITAATLPPMAADLDYYSFKEYLSKWLRKNEDRHATGAEAMVAAFRRSRQMFATHVRWEYEIAKKKFTPFDELASVDLEKRFVEGAGECVFDTNNEVFEVDLDSMMMYSERAEYKLRRKVTILEAAEGEALSNDTHTVVRDLPGPNTAASWTYKPHKDPTWQHFNRYQAFALERAFREGGMPASLEVDVGGLMHVIVTIDTPDPDTGRHRGPHIRPSSEPAFSNKYSMLRRVLVPREHSHSSDVMWRMECPLMYAALAMQETRPSYARAFREMEQGGEIVLRPESLDDGDEQLYALLREMIDRWAIVPTAFVVPGDMLRYEVLVEGTWVPLVPMNNWLMQPSTLVANPKTSASVKSFPHYICNAKKSIDHVVFLFKQWLPFDSQTMTIYLPSEEGINEGGKVLWCRVAEEHEAVVRFLLKGNEPWICSRDLLLSSSMLPRKFLEANYIVSCLDHSAKDCSAVLLWAANGFPRDGRPMEAQKAAEFLGFEKQWMTGK